MENTLENKSKFFAQYWGQEVLKVWDCTDPIKVDFFGRQYIGSLYLKSIYSISYEDAIEVAKFEGYKQESFKHMVLSFDIKTDINSIQCCFFSATSDVYETLGIGVCDYLRSKGYALPWMGLSVEQLIEYGWIKLSS